MKKDFVRYTLRIERDILEKFTYITEYTGRSKNKEIRHMIIKAIQAYEAENEPIVLTKKQENESQ